MPDNMLVRPADDEARNTARRLVDCARFGALGVLDPDTGFPLVARVAVGTDDDGQPVSLVSDLSQHTRALGANPACSLMVGEPGTKGDPLSHPRLTIQARARFVRKGTVGYDDVRARWLRDHPKSGLYVDFGDFSFVQFRVESAFLNGGFGKAFRLSPEDLA